MTQSASRSPTFRWSVSPGCSPGYSSRKASLTVMAFSSARRQPAALQQDRHRAARSPPAGPGCGHSRNVAPRRVSTRPARTRPGLDSLHARDAEHLLGHFLDAIGPAQSPDSRPPESSCVSCITFWSSDTWTLNTAIKIAPPSVRVKRVSASRRLRRKVLRMRDQQRAGAASAAAATSGGAATLWPGRRPSATAVSARLTLMRAPPQHGQHTRGRGHEQRDKGLQRTTASGIKAKGRSSES